MHKRKLWVVLLAGLAGLAPAGRAQEKKDAQPLAREIFKELIEINTTDSVGNVTTAAEAVARRLRAAGFAGNDLQVAGPNERKKNVIARIHGTGQRKPLLLLAHLDVVEARREDWSTDPFQFSEKDGYFYGRGTEDIKDGAAILVANVLRLKKEGFVPDRDLILALTADEEGGDFNGVEWLLAHHREWIDAEYCVNLDGGDFMSEHGKKLYAAVQASEKVYVDFQLETRNPGGHSSRPSPDNAIYHLAGGLERLANYSFPVQLNEITRAMLERSAAFHGGQEGEDMRAAAKTPPDAAAVARLSGDSFYNAILRTTCVATRLDGGHANNALPQRARAIVNCRILPGEDPQQIRETLVRVVADPQIAVTFVEQLSADGKPILPVSVPPSPLRADVMDALESSVHAMWPALPVLPVMDTGASDGKFLRLSGIPTYGISGVFLDLDNHRAHGQDERVGVQDFYDGVDFNYRLIRALASGK
jgi:acetylornithine deacetylase/succinyl-diaminopimelate desuccinylase-like protein